MKEPQLPIGSEAIGEGGATKEETADVTVAVGVLEEEEADVDVGEVANELG